MTQDPYAQARAVLATVACIASDQDLGHVLRGIVEAATRLVGARYGALGVLESAGVGLTDLVVSGVEPGTAEAVGHQPQGVGLIGLLVTRPGPLRLTDLTEHPDSVGFPAGHPRMRSFLGVPVRVRGAVHGALYLTDKSDGAAFSEDDEELLLLLATAAGFVIDHARAYQAGERRRHWLEMTAGLVDAVQSAAGQDEALAEVVDRAWRSRGAVAGAAWWDDGDTGPLRVARSGSTAPGSSTTWWRPGSGWRAGRSTGRSRRWGSARCSCRWRPTCCHR